MSFDIGAGIAKAAGGVADIAENQIKNSQQLNMQQELQDIETAKQLALKEALYRQDQSHVTDERSRIEDTLQTARDALTQPSSEAGGYDPKAQKSYKDMSPKEQFMFDANTLKNNGDMKGYDDMLARAKAFEPEKETLKDFDPSHIVINGKGDIVYNGQGNSTSFKSEEDIWSASQNPNDPRHDLANNMIKAKGNEKVRVAIAGRAPRQESELEQKAAAMVKTGQFSTIDEAIASMARTSGITPMEQVRNKEIDKARELIGNLSADEIKRKTAKFTNTGRNNADFDPQLESRVAIAAKRKVGDDPVFDGYKADVSSPVNDIANRFKSDATMKGYQLGKQSPNGFEVHDDSGKLVGHYK